MQPTTPFSPAFFADPFPTFAALRQGPLQRIQMFTQEAWLLTRYADVMTVLRDVRFTLNPPRTPGDAPVVSHPDVEASPILSFPHLLSTDGLDHRRLRALVSQGFTPRFIEDLRPAVRRLAHQLIDTIQDSGRGHFELIEAFAFPLPIRVISTMLGLPEEDQERFRHWSSALVNDLTDKEANGQFIVYLLELFGRKRREPGDDLISALVGAGDGEDVLNERELIGMVMLLIIAGHETTSNLLGNGVLALLTRPAELDRLRAHPELMERAVEELLRLEGPVTMPVPRYASEDVMLGGQLIRRGEAVMLVLASADRDETQFTDPAELDIARSVNRHLAFGQGVHYCLGAPLARMEAEEALSALLERFPDLTLDVDPRTLTRTTSPFLRGLKALPLRYSGNAAGPAGTR